MFLTNESALIILVGAVLTLAAMAVKLVVDLVRGRSNPSRSKSKQSMKKAAVIAAFLASIAFQGRLFAADLPAESPAARRQSLRQFALSHKGDAKRGRVVASKLSCASCHDLEGAEQIVGPALSNVGSRLSLQDIVDQILDPSQKKLILVEFEDGTTKQVVLVNEDRKTLSVRNTQTQELQTLEKAKVDFKPVRSDMPEGQADALQPSEFGDLVAYLIALKGR